MRLGIGSERPANLVGSLGFHVEVLSWLGPPKRSRKMTDLA